MKMGKLLNLNNMRYKPQGLKSKLLQYLKDNGIISRLEAYNWSKKHHYHQSTFERRCRELCNEAGVVALNHERKPVDRRISETIWGWKYRPTTVFHKKLVC